MSSLEPGTAVPPSVPDENDPPEEIIRGEITIPKGYFYWLAVTLVSFLLATVITVVFLALMFHLHVGAQ